MIYTIDSKVVLGWFIKRWLGELTWIDEGQFLAPTPPRVLAHYSTLIPWPLLYLWPIYSSLYPPPSLDPETLIHILLVRIRASSQDVEVE